MRIVAKRIHEAPAAEDGTRVLVDRLWPRGISKERAELDRWAKEIAPTSELRTWYQHDARKFGEFAERYRAELDTDEARRVLRELVELAGDGTLTLLTSTRAIDISHTTVLTDVLGELAKRND